MRYSSQKQLKRLCCNFQNNCKNRSSVNSLCRFVPKYSFTLYPIYLSGIYNVNEALYTIENKLWASVLVRRFSCATLPPIYYFAPPSVPSGCTGLDKDWLDRIGQGINSI